MEIHDYNLLLKECKTADDFEKLKANMYNSGTGAWFYTKKHNEVNSIHARITRLKSGISMYCSYGEPIIKNGKHCVAYDTVREPRTRIIPIDMLYRYWIIR